MINICCSSLRKADHILKRSQKLLPIFPICLGKLELELSLPTFRQKYHMCAHRYDTIYNDGIEMGQAQYIYAR